jgi:HSP20 family molecular chaperone IbpA
MSSSTDLPRNDFYQSEDRFTVSFYVKGLKAEDVSVSFRETSVRSSHALMTRDRVAERVKLN